MRVLLFMVLIVSPGCKTPQEHAKAFFLEGLSAYQNPHYNTAPFSRWKNRCTYSPNPPALEVYDAGGQPREIERHVPDITAHLLKSRSLTIDSIAIDSAPVGAKVNVDEKDNTVPILALGFAPCTGMS